MITFKSLEEPEIIEMKERQNTDCAFEISELVDFDPFWAPISLEQLKEKLKEKQKRPRTGIFSIWTEKANQFIGVAQWSASWDTWCPDAGVIIWPEYRRKGYGTEVAEKLLDICFIQNPGHGIVTGAPEWNDASLNFIKSLGFKDCGRMRRLGMKDNEYYDLIFFDLLKNEYMADRKEANK